MANKGTLHILDVGGEIYGDCILVTAGDQKILIDGAHPGDSELIRGQLSDIIGGEGPFDIDLLIVTHCHRDHIGCLPDLVADGTLRVRKALMADEELGFGGGGEDAVAGGLGDQLFAAAREEPMVSDRPADVEAFLADAVKLENRYRSMLAKLGNKVVRYRGQSLHPLQNTFAEFGLEILGPSKKHLEICAGELVRLREKSRRRAGARRGEGDVAATLAELYREYLDRAVDSDSGGAADMAGPGAALNDQSIVIKMTLNGTPVLLTGDQQFAKAETPGLADSMRALRKKVVDDGPYPIMKVAHHGSYNGIDEDLIDTCQSTTLLFSGGFNDPGHPSGDVLALLKKRRDTLTWLRTDKNGRIDVRFLANGPAIEYERGRQDDYKANPKPHDLGVAVPATPAAATPVKPQLTIERLRDGYVEVSASAKLPPDVDSIQVTFDIRRSGRGTRVSASQKPPSSSEEKEEPEPACIADAKRLPDLLFVTNQRLLERNVGEAAASALAAIQSAGKDIMLLGEQADPWIRVQQKLRSKNYDGVVLLGGYDVVPAARMDCLGTLRGSLSREDLASDQDGFVIWSDDVYGDVEQDQDPELPVSRIPDGADGRFLLRCLSAQAARERRLGGLRNLKRPFADRIQLARPGGTVLKTSGPHVAAQIQRGEVASGSYYLMLHGADFDTSEFWGEQDGILTHAFSIANVPGEFSGCVFAGCCYGALVAQLPAARVRAGDPCPARSASQSIALAFLSAGATAFVGCTGTHYSPMEPPYESLGGPMHRVFFERYDKGEGPAKALLSAKQTYAREIPHGMDMAAGQAVELKTLRQFTCLGLGW